MGENKVNNNNTKNSSNPRGRGFGAPAGSGARRPGGRGHGGKGGRPGGRGFGAGQKVKSEFDQKIIDIRRVVRVTAGGKRFNFRVTIVAGDRKGRVGLGMGKSADTAGAIEKAFRTAKKNLIKPKLTKEFSIPYELEAKFTGSYVTLRPAKGRGLVAGSSTKDVLDLAGVKDVNAKILTRSKNKVNNAMATLKALEKLK
ncbi:MAG: 30S ribosomal protein S5 [Candidatus Terrybacteria bacterium CG10_big_fil_rev_8_21_14_0_10_41_10]|uniref:Small ribosomal subunit protein uS5 n=1 Tax=Candidatus Terrybacteria bacterium CG10_big_fil_rev_8_21_14_0_10_41_10 TaxID=1975026 RepID=A0A2M8LAU0_9BACT|nr:MAG: 30S ribosomal protein S5 [Candidatus Terrybacteria bacterium CG10_big_fil_rev_8_21_14_0_10_41_10]